MNKGNTIEIPGLQYKTELIRPEQKKPGLRILGPDTPQDYAFNILLYRQRLTREMISELGVIVFENNKLNRSRHRALDTHYDRSTPQPLHRDFGIWDWTFSGDQEAQMMTNGVVGLASDSKGKRNARTMIGDRREVLKAHLEFFEATAPKTKRGRNKEANNDNHVLKILEEIRDHIAEFGIEGALDNDIKEHVYRTKVPLAKSFFDLNSRRLEHNYLPLRDLHQALSEVTYQHEWQPNQLVIFDDVDMVHARTTGKIQEETQAVIYRYPVYWKHGYPSKFKKRSW